MPVKPFRQLITEPGNAPPWLREGTGERYLYPIGLMLDARMDRLVQGMKCRIPRSTIARYRAPDDALNAIGAQRGPIVRGPTETSDAYALRLQQAPSEWQIWGNPRSVLDQVCAYFSPLPMTARLVTDSGHWYTMTMPGNVYTILPPSARPPAVVSNWSWDGNARWWRSWVIVHLPLNYASYLAALWDGSSLWDGGAIWDGLPKAVFDGLLAIITQWYPEHALSGEAPAGLIVTDLQPTDDIPGHPGVHPFDPSSVSTTNTDGSTNLPTSNWGSPIWTSGPSFGLPSRPSWATFYAINNS